MSSEMVEIEKKKHTSVSLAACSGNVKKMDRERKARGWKKNKK